MEYIQLYGLNSGLLGVEGLRWKLTHSLGAIVYYASA